MLGQYLMYFWLSLVQYSSWNQGGKLPSCDQTALRGTTSSDPWFTGSPQPPVCLRKWMTGLIILVNASGQCRGKESFSSSNDFGKNTCNWSALESWGNPFLKRLPHYLGDCTVTEFQRGAWAGASVRTRSREESGPCPLEICPFIMSKMTHI